MTDICIPIKIMEYKFKQINKRFYPQMIWSNVPSEGDAVIKLPPVSRWCYRRTGGCSDSPSAHDEPQRLQVPVVRGPQGRCHPVLIRGVQLLPCGFPQRVQVAVPGRPVVPVVHSGGPAHSRFGAMEVLERPPRCSGNVLDRDAAGPDGLERLTGWLLGDERAACWLSGRGGVWRFVPPPFTV